MPGRSTCPLHTSMGPIPTSSTSCAVVGLESGPRSTSQTPPIERKSCRSRTNKIALLQNFAAQADRLGEALEGERTELFSCDGSFTEPIAATRLGSGNRSSCPLGTRDPSGALVRAFVNVTHDRGRSKIPSHANMARCQRCELGATLSFLGQYVPRTGSREPGPT